MAAKWITHTLLLLQLEVAVSAVSGLCLGFWMSTAAGHAIETEAGSGCVSQETLEAFFANSKGEECVFTWRAIGGGLVTLLPAMTYTLRVNP